jgi:hypothetical protein
MSSSSSPSSSSPSSPSELGALTAELAAFAATAVSAKGDGAGMSSNLHSCVCIYQLLDRTHSCILALEQLYVFTPNQIQELGRSLSDTLALARAFLAKFSSARDYLGFAINRSKLVQNDFVGLFMRLPLTALRAILTLSSTGGAVEQVPKAKRCLSDLMETFRCAWTTLIESGYVGSNY